MNTPPTRTPSDLPGLHPRLTVLQAAPEERAALAEQLTELCAGDDADATAEPETTFGAKDFHAAAREAAIRRVETHERVRDELAARLRRARELQGAAANRRDEAAARTRRLSSHLADCDMLLERAGELTNAAEDARRALDDRRAELDTARRKLALVDEQRAAAQQMIQDASQELYELETSELDETSLRREIEKANDALRAAEEAEARSTDALRAMEQAAAARAATRDHLLQVRAELVARVEAPLVDTEDVRSALAAFDADTTVGEGDPVACELAREWMEVDDELSRIEDALPAPPTPQEIEAAERHLQQIDASIAQLEAAGQPGSLPPEAREEIEAAHEAVLLAEDDLDRLEDYDEAVARLEHARGIEHEVLARHGYETYLDVILTGPGEDDQADLLDALRARRVAEDTLASLRAAAEPPAIVSALRARCDRIYREAADVLGCDPGENVAELLYAHPVVPRQRTQALAAALAAVGVVPVGVSVREQAIAWLVAQDHELAARDECRNDLDRVDEELAHLEEQDAEAAAEAETIVEVAQVTYDDLAQAHARVNLLEGELRDRAIQDDRRLHRIAAAEQLRAQIAAVTEAIERSDEEYHSSVGAAEAATVAAEATLERATAELSDAVRRLRRISEALPPALRPRAGDDPLGELPRLRETLANEVERAEVALDTATTELERARAEIDETQSELDDHLTVVPTDDITDDDLGQAVRDMLAGGDRPAIVEDPFGQVEDVREVLLDVLASVSARRQIVLLTDDPVTLGWAISLPPDVGAVTRMPTPPAPDRPPGEAPPLAAQHQAAT
ncbi:MAG: hypothetical protein ACLFXM_04535 [Acidimicrobiia bacterium]